MVNISITIYTFVSAICILFNIYIDQYPKYCFINILFTLGVCKSQLIYIC